ncbi:secretin and TonB N-terminal domain-containing protein [Pectobacterium brasiliense]|uniref:secretin and TonB N-terminal domain-containing protein n=1 Tax=Pectobacterium brasiliense TaxID=180957 RepID=UPI0009D661C4|nr:secretin and TonB N-terminal domain-containing protein [Pectobacterium brasiliense]MBN3097952.1 secretin and TonB N-terminal domain-containing protein [Pectobacterium brasiliense]MBN3103196.1 secretin and TonB N-terminal domain-containing protein [Pectobacterium brasiliense]MBN3163993.1 secretin and TonB N-terminal domain-containing protein [Pectobacterium brasiliense]MBN3181376.1 secretin and TonB N-terminal domain-containing protein [Pectobacterium brasiliense]PPE60895.1 TonB-dependent re
MRNFLGMRNTIWPTAMLTLALSGGGSALGATAPAQSIHLPAQSLEKSLTQLARQTGVNFGVDSQLVAGKQAPALEGNYTVEQALDRLLNSNNLYAEPTEAGKAFIIRPMASMFASDDAQTVNTSAANSRSGTENNGDVITVKAQITPGPMEIGSQQLVAEEIAKKPTSNGNITELLRTNPNVQFSETSRNSETPGELAPDVVSFHGEKFYNNNFMIDGMSNNDRLNPGVNVGEVGSTANGNAANDFPSGHPESFWIDSNLIDSLSVYDSNVSAKYGQFTGGVIDAKLKKPSFTEPSGSVSYRTTRSSWTKYHLEKREEASFSAATTLKRQPKFTKNFYNLNVSQPLNDNAALMFVYSRKESDIPFWHTIFQRWEDQSRESETYMLRGAWDANERNQFSLSLMHSPHSASYVRSNMKDAGFTAEGGGYNANLKWDNQNKWGKVATQLIWKQNENTIKNKGDNFYAWAKTDSIDWVSSFSGSAAQQGGYGTVRTEQSGINFKQDWQLNPFFAWGVQHQFDFGFDTDFSKARYQRRDTSYSYGVAVKNAAIVCKSGDSACINGEQYLSQRAVYEASDVSVAASTYAAYLQDTLIASRLTIVPGVRVDYDDYMKNMNVSPRFSTSYDVWGDRSTEVFGGVNRYYAGNVLAYKLREARKQPYNECRANTLKKNGTGGCTESSLALTPDDWVFGRKLNQTNYRYTSLNTPYSDELNLGLQQRIYDTVWALKWVHREAKDQFSAEQNKTTKTYELTNNGKSESDTFSLVIKPVSPIEWNSAVFSWTAGGNIQKSTSSNKDYDTEADLDGYILYNGKMIRAIDKPADNFNRPWTAFLELNTEIPNWRLDWTQRLSYVGGYKAMTRTETINCPNDDRCSGYVGATDVYEEEQYGNNMLLDWRVAYTQPLGKQNLKVGVDVLNVLNKANKNESNYGLGRQFWLDVTYSW